MSPELIGSIFAGIVALVSAAGTYAATRNKRLVKSERSLRRENQNLRRLFEIALRYIYRLRRQLISLGRSPVKAPAELELDTQEEDVVDDTA